MPVEIPVEKWNGQVHQVKLGGAGGRKELVVGGENTLPFLKFEGNIPHRPAVAIEVVDQPPQGWAEPLVKAWGNVLQDPAAWAKKAAEYGADLISLRLRSAHPEEGNTGADHARKVVAAVLAAVDLPVIVLGPEVAQKDNEVLVAASEVGRGQRLGLGDCLDKNYRTIGATCLADGHVAIAKTPIDMNLAKQLNILLSDLGLPLDAILMDPTTGALGYGLEYTYSVMERLRITALMGDKMTSPPMICTAGEESWRQKESKATAGVPQSWGEQEQRAILWEKITAIGLLNAGANVIVLRHPRTVEDVKAAINKLSA
ncbi:MAG: acetyl-CoA decarbonylase/synthase complex subunit delta [Chloroflexi bacterium]|nr:acetyl-CoA decarbonylase/synthase complex subunit delta [Chloroflexota bacterium]